jgi:hypothetical protein
MSEDLKLRWQEHSHRVEGRIKSTKNYTSKSLDNIQAKNQRIYAWDKPLSTIAMLHH